MNQQVRNSIKRVEYIIEKVMEYNLSKDKKFDALLKYIVKIAILKLLSRIPIEAIKDIQITGSIANGEGTVIKCDSKVVTSDVDIVVYLGFPYFIIATIKGIFENLSQEVNLYLSAKGLKTHICFTGTTRITKLFSYFSDSHIYDFEFIKNKSLYNQGSLCMEKRAHMPTKKDALQLTFTVIADYLFLDSLAPSDIEKVYLLAKRFLTLIHALLIFEGNPKFSYKERVTAIETTPKISDFLSTSEKEFLRKFTYFKLNGKLSYIFDAFKSTDIMQIITFQKELLVSIVLKIISYELQELYGSKISCRQKIVNNSILSPEEKLMILLNTFFIQTRKSVLNSLIYTYVLAIILLFTKRFHMLNLVGPLLTSRHSLIDLANYLIGLTFISNVTSRINRQLLMNIELPIKKLTFNLNDILVIWNLANQVKYLS